MLNLILLILGDILMTVLIGLYAGVGIRESASPQHITMMILPCVLVWLLSARLCKLYPKPSEVNESLSAPREGSFFKRLNALLDKVIDLQRPKKLLIVWLISSLFAILWQSFYWDQILHSAFRHGLLLQLIIWYCTSCAAFFMLWRFAWSAFVTLRSLSRENHMVRIVCLVLIALVIAWQIPPLVLSLHYAPQKLTLGTAEEKTLPDTAIVFAAGVYQNGQASSVLIDRVDTAVDLYKKGKISRMIMSGDNSDASRNEVDVMEKLALEAGVPADAIIKDEVGLHTAESCYNAHNVYGVDEAVMITQGFHTTRVLYTCDHYKTDGVSVSADRSVYNIFSWMVWHLRDWLGLTPVWLHYSLQR